MDQGRGVRVLLVDDNTQFLEAAARFLAQEPRLTIVGRAQSSVEAAEMVDRLRPDVVLMDLAMPGTDGLETTRLIKASATPPRVIIVTQHDTPSHREAAAKIADGFVSKAEFGSELMPTIEQLFFA
jgi:DNA-binding NarL/FixJ family response regulator